MGYNLFFPTSITKPPDWLRSRYTRSIFAFPVDEALFGNYGNSIGRKTRLMISMFVMGFWSRFDVVVRDRWSFLAGLKTSPAALGEATAVEAGPDLPVLRIVKEIFSKWGIP